MLVEPGKNSEQRTVMSRSEVARKGGEATARRHGSKFYEEIGRKGGWATAQKHAAARLAEAKRQTRTSGARAVCLEMAVGDDARRNNYAQYVSAVQEGDVIIVEVKHESDATTAPFLTQDIQHWLNLGVRRFALDLDKCEYIDSAGLRAIIDGLKCVRESDGDIVLVCAYKRIRYAIQIVGLDRILDLFESRDQALAHLSDKSK